jgi:hypothetical protein
MTFSKPFNEDERAYIRRMWGVTTSGDIAKELNRWYTAYNEGKRTPDGVRRYIAEMNGARVEIEMPREIQDQLKDNGHNPAEVKRMVEKGVAEAIRPLVEKPKHKAKA